MRVIWICGTALSIVGLLILLLAGMAWSSERTFSKHAFQSLGTVVELDREVESSSDGGHHVYYYPSFEFTTSDGRVVTVRSTSGTNPPAHRIGERVRLWYDPENPEHMEIDSFAGRWRTVLVPGLMGAIFATIGTALLAWTIRRQRLRAWLAKHGVRVHARLERVELDYSVKLDGQNPWRLIAQWHNTKTNKVYLYHSDSLWFDPRPFVQRTEVDVVIDPSNPKRYVMDTSFLPELG